MVSADLELSRAQFRPAGYSTLQWGIPAGESESLTMMTSSRSSTQMTLVSRNRNRIVFLSFRFSPSLWLFASVLVFCGLLSALNFLASVETLCVNDLHSQIRHSTLKRDVCEHLRRT